MLSNGLITWLRQRNSSIVIVMPMGRVLDRISTGLLEMSKVVTLRRVGMMKSRTINTEVEKVLSLRLDILVRLSGRDQKKLDLVMQEEMW